MNKIWFVKYVLWSVIVVLMRGGRIVSRFPDEIKHQRWREHKRAFMISKLQVISATPVITWQNISVKIYIEIVHL